jgi:hypothetical protein
VDARDGYARTLEENKELIQMLQTDLKKNIDLVKQHEISTE